MKLPTENGSGKTKRYRVELFKHATYDAEIEVVTESEQHADRIAHEMDDNPELDWYYDDAGGDTKVRRIVDDAKKDGAFKKSPVKAREAVAKEVRVGTR